MDLGGFEAIKGWGQGGLGQLTLSTSQIDAHTHTQNNDSKK